MHCAIVSEAIDVASVVDLVQSPDRGGIISFVGSVRDHNRGRRVLYLEYEAYPEMACAKMEEIGREIMARWDVADVAMVHRVGRLELGDIVVVIALSAAHRSDLFDACRYAIDRLKEIVPIWKKEVFEGGAEWISEHA